MQRKRQIVVREEAKEKEKESCASVRRVDVSSEEEDLVKSGKW